MPTSQGTAHVFGVSGSITNATVVSTSLTDQHLNQGTVVDEQGNQIERRYDDLSEQGTITLRYQAGYTIPTPGGVVSWNNGGGATTYEITEVGKEQESQGFRQVSLSVINSANIAEA
jgi:hypothetical protein